MAKMGRPATGQGVNKYVPIALLSLFGVLLYLLKQGDSDSVAELESLAMEKALAKGWNGGHASVQGVNSAIYTK